MMIARAAEANPSIFLPTGPVSTCEKLIPTVFLPLVIYLKNHYSNTKFLLYQFKPSHPPISQLTKSERKGFSDGIAAAKTIEDAAKVWGLNMDEAQQRGKVLMRELEDQFRKIDPQAYPEAYITESPEDDLHSHEKASVAQETKPVDIFEERKQAEKEGTVVDSAPEEATLQQEELDEEAMMNA